MPLNETTLLHPLKDYVMTLQCIILTILVEYDPIANSDVIHTNMPLSIMTLDTVIGMGLRWGYRSWF